MQDGENFSVGFTADAVYDADHQLNMPERALVALLPAGGYCRRGYGGYVQRAFFVYHQAGRWGAEALF
jgi:hypothetical protein